MFRRPIFQPDHIILFCTNWSPESKSEITVGRVLRITGNRLVVVGLGVRGYGTNRPNGALPYRIGQLYRVPQQACVLFQDAGTNEQWPDEVRLFNSATNEPVYRRWNRRGSEGRRVVTQLVRSHNTTAEYQPVKSSTLSKPLDPLTFLTFSILFSQKIKKIRRVFVVMLL